MVAMSHYDKEVNLSKTHGISFQFALGYATEVLLVIRILTHFFESIIERAEVQLRADGILSIQPRLILFTVKINLQIPGVISNKSWQKCSLPHSLIFCRSLDSVTPEVFSPKVVLESVVPLDRFCFLNPLVLFPPIKKFTRYL